MNLQRPSIVVFATIWETDSNTPKRVAVVTILAAKSQTVRRASLARVCAIAWGVRTRSRVLTTSVIGPAGRLLMIELYPMLARTHPTVRKTTRVSVKTNCWTMPAGERSLSKISPRSIPRLERSMVLSSGEAAGWKDLEEGDGLKESKSGELYLFKLEGLESSAGEDWARAAPANNEMKDSFCRQHIISCRSESSNK